MFLYRALYGHCTGTVRALDGVAKIVRWYSDRARSYDGPSNTMCLRIFFTTPEKFIHRRRGATVDVKNIATSARCYKMLCCHPALMSSTHTHTPATLFFNIDEIIRPAWSSHHLNIKEFDERGNAITNMRSKNNSGSDIFDINRWK